MQWCACAPSPCLRISSDPEGGWDITATPACRAASQWGCYRACFRATLRLLYLGQVLNNPLNGMHSVLRAPCLARALAEGNPRPTLCLKMHLMSLFTMQQHYCSIQLLPSANPLLKQCSTALCGLVQWIR